MADDLPPESERTESEPTEPTESVPEVSPDGDEYPLLSENEFDDVLTALETYPDEEDLDEEPPPSDEAADDMPIEEEQDAAQAAALGEVDEDDRLRLPRAQLFRHRLRNQITMLPLALYLLALGAYLIARERDMIADLPDWSSLALGVITVLVVASTLVFRALIGGRQERGLLLLGVWVWVTTGLLFVLVYGIDETADAARWWPLLLWSLGAAFILIYPVERTHDVRLLWLGTLTLLAGGVAYAVTSEQIDEESLQDAVDFWPLLLSVLGVGLLPLAFRRRIEQER